MAAGRIALQSVKVYLYNSFLSITHRSLRVGMTRRKLALFQLSGGLECTLQYRLLLVMARYEPSVGCALKHIATCPAPRTSHYTIVHRSLVPRDDG
jgi:hypothetical protein